MNSITYAKKQLTFFKTVYKVKKQAVGGVTSCKLK